MEAFEYYGEWWIPNDSEHLNSVAGILRFNPIEGGSLELIGGDFSHEAFELFSVQPPDSPWRIYSRESFDLIWGFTSKGQPVTLHICTKISSAWAKHYTGGKFHIGVIFIGCLFSKPEDMIFERMIVCYSYLRDWLRLTGFENTKKRLEGNKWEIRINYDSPDPVEINLGDFNISFHNRVRSSDSDHSQRIDIEENAFAEFRPTKPLHYDGYQDTLLYYFRNFLSLATDVAVVPVMVFGVTSNYESIDGDDDDVKPHKAKEIQIFYRAKGADIPTSDSFLKIKVFSYTEVATGFEKYLGKWFEKSTQLRIVHDLYFGITYIPSIYVHVKLLTLAQALEAYHRRLYGGQYLTEDQYESVLKTLVNAIPDEVSADHRSSLANAVKYGYQYSLRKRLQLIFQQVLKDYEDIVIKLFGEKKLQKIFIDKFVNARNDFTHYPEDMEELDKSKLREIRDLIEMADLLMKLCFFAEMGFSPDLVRKIVANNTKFQQHMDS